MDLFHTHTQCCLGEDQNLSEQKLYFGPDMYIFSKTKNSHSTEKLNKLIISAGPKCLVW